MRDRKGIVYKVWAIEIIGKRIVRDRKYEGRMYKG